MNVDENLIKDMIARHDRLRPRSRQRSIGPSEIGGACERRIGYSLSDVPTINGGGLSLPSWIGTAAHEAMAKAIEVDGAWESEVRVELPGTEALTETGEPIAGTLDAFHRPSGTVVDWKFLADSTIKKAATLGTVSEQYRTQVHLYGYGLEAAGETVREVAVAFIPRSGNPRLIYVWSEPYDPAVAATALTRLADIRKVARGGYVSALRTADQWCQSCPWYLPASTELHQACPGHQEPSATPADGTDNREGRQAV